MSTPHLLSVIISCLLTHSFFWSSCCFFSFLLAEEAVSIVAYMRPQCVLMLWSASCPPWSGTMADLYKRYSGKLKTTLFRFNYTQSSCDCWVSKSTWSDSESSKRDSAAKYWIQATPQRFDYLRSILPPTMTCADIGQVNADVDGIGVSCYTQAGVWSHRVYIDRSWYRLSFNPFLRLCYLLCLGSFLKKNVKMRLAHYSCSRWLPHFYLDCQYCRKSLGHDIGISLWTT